MSEPFPQLFDRFRHFRFAHHGPFRLARTYVRGVTVTTLSFALVACGSGGGKAAPPATSSVAQIASLVATDTVGMKDVNQQVLDFIGSWNCALDQSVCGAAANARTIGTNASRLFDDLERSHPPAELVALVTRTTSVAGQLKAASAEIADAGGCASPPFVGACKTAIDHLGSAAGLFKTTLAGWQPYGVSST